MKIDRLETHDRYQHFLGDQEKVIAEGASECLMRNPLSLALQDYSPYIYVYGHFRTHEDGVTQRLIWQPKLCKPAPSPNTFLFRGLSGTDLLEPCWVLPKAELFEQFKDGTVIEGSEYIQWCIWMYKNKKKELGEPHKDDLSEEKQKEIWLKVARELEESARAKKSSLILPEFKRVP